MREKLREVSVFLIIFNFAFVSQFFYYYCFFVSFDFKQRVFTVSIPQLILHVKREALPKRLGGVLELQHDAWLLHCFKSMTNRNGTEPAEPPVPAAPTTPSDAAATTATGSPSLIAGTNANQPENEINSSNDEAPSPLQPPSSASSGFRYTYIFFFFLNFTLLTNVFIYFLII